MADTPRKKDYLFGEPETVKAPASPSPKPAKKPAGPAYEGLPPGTIASLTPARDPHFVEPPPPARTKSVLPHATRARTTSSGIGEPRRPFGSIGGTDPAPPEWHQRTTPETSRKRDQAIRARIDEELDKDDLSEEERQAARDGFEDSRSPLDRIFRTDPSDRSR